MTDDSTNLGAKLRRVGESGPGYVNAHPQYLGNGMTRSCGACGKHRAQGPGWGKVAVLGQVCPDCMALRAERRAARRAGAGA